jgi:hypothetical protein
MRKNQVTDPIKQDTDEQSRLKQTRQRVLDRLWEIADLDPERTRGSASAQVKAISMIVAIEGLIPDRRAACAQNKPAHPPVKAEIYQAAWLREQREKAGSPPTPTQQKSAPEPQSDSGSADGPPPVSNPTTELAASTSSAGPKQPTSLAPRVPGADFVAPDTRVPAATKKYYPFSWGR